MKKKTAYLPEQRVLRLALFLTYLLIITNFMVLIFNLQHLENEVINNQVMGVTTSTTSQSWPKKVYIPLGGGETSLLNVWENTGAQTYINLADYPNLKSINWETSLRIPTASGKVYARLVNATDNVEIWNSELVAEGSSFTFVSSPPLTLWQGDKLYRAQLKSTMGTPVEMVGARIVVTLR